MNEKITSNNEISELDDFAFRPLELVDFTGQSSTLKNLSIYIKGAKKRREPLDHILFYGPPGLGKTTLSRIISEELGVGFKTISAPMITKPSHIISLLTSLNDKDVLFIDEIHRLPLSVEEILYSAMEDFKLSILVDSNGTIEDAIEIPISRFTLVAATTRKGMLSQPLSDRFGIQFRMDYYEIEELSKIIIRAAKKMNLDLLDISVVEISKRSRGTPRIALRLLRRIRDFIDSGIHNKYETQFDFISDTLNELGISENGLDELDNRYLDCLDINFNGGPVGIEALSASLSESRETLETSVEPFLLRQGLIIRTPRGRKLNKNVTPDLFS